MKRFLILLAVALPLLFLSQLGDQPIVSAEPPDSGSQDERHEGLVTRLIEDKKLEVAPGVVQPYQQIEMEITSGKLRGRKVIAELGGAMVSDTSQRVKVGDRIYVTRIEKAGGGEAFYVSDFVRQAPLYILGIAFFLAVVVVGGVRGLASFVGLVVSFVVLLYYILPRIVAGENPVFVAITGSFFILLAALYLAHGFSRKTTAAVIGTSASLIITGLLAWAFVSLARLSGLGSEDAALLSLQPGMQVNLQGILLGGIIIGALGVLDDITVSQSASVFELHSVDSSLSWQELYLRGTRIGRDHIASTVNTLVLAYAGASLPLLLLFTASGGEAFEVLINREMIANEIVRTLVGSLGLVSAVPITTALAASFCRWKRKS